jgi:NADH-quinone oxidoreductase subunit F
MTGQRETIGRSPLVRVSTAVGAAGSGPVVAAAREAAGDVPVVRTGPTGLEAYDPLLLATRAGRTALFPDVSPSRSRAVATALADGELPTDEATAVVEHDPNPTTMPRPLSGPLSVGRRHALGACGWVDPLSASDREFASPDADPPAELGLRGRGRGDAGGVVTDVWETVRETDGNPVVVVNANEPYRHQRGDRTLLAGDPMAVLDGAAAVARFVGADDIVVYGNESESALLDHVSSAADAASDALDVAVQVVAGPDVYRAGTPTPALEALEGADRVEPRVQPPTPATYGLYGRPTAVHTPRTLGQVAAAMRTPDAFDAADADPGTRLFSVVGDVEASAVVELPSSASLRAAREAVDPTGEVTFAAVGGKFGGVTKSLDVAPTEGSLTAAGLGTDGVVELFGRNRCVVATVGDRARFASEENSGRCVPGREGTVQLAELLRDVYEGSFEPEKIRELGRVMRRSSNCEIGAHAPRPVLSALDEFEPAFRAHAAGRCPSNHCRIETN